MLHRGVKQKDIFHEHKTQSRFKMLTCSHWAGGVYFVFAVVFEFYQHLAHVNYVRSPTAQGEGLVNGTRIGSLYIYIYIRQTGGVNLYYYFFRPDPRGRSKKRWQKLVKHEKYTLETKGAKVYTTKSSDNNSVSLFRPTPAYFYTSKAVQEKTFSIKRVPNHPIL